MSASAIHIAGARVNNLRDLSLRIPHHRLTVVTGVSGSGKSSLAFDLLAREGQRRYYATLPSFARAYVEKLSRPDVDAVTGLAPVVVVGQRTGGAHARSTVGTLSDLYDALRLLFARAGRTPLDDVALSRALFSFNSELGRCPRCRGIGREERIDLGRLVAHPERTIREGALAPTLPTGYVMYSQVTVDVLDDVCRAEGFSVDVPWRALSPRQREVVLYGSDKLKVPFGKHALAARLKWTGIKAKPREEGHYRGLVPVMTDILRRDRNASILKYVEAVTCPACEGTRLNPAARSVTVHGRTIAKLSRLELRALHDWVTDATWAPQWRVLIGKLTDRLALLTDLGLGHLTLDRPAATLRPGEVQRIRIANQLRSPLSDVLYVLDEPSLGLHPSEGARLVHHLRGLVARGNTVVVVEHDLATVRSADYLIELGPGAGSEGGALLYAGPLGDFGLSAKLRATSPTYRALQEVIESRRRPRPSQGELVLTDCHARNLAHVDVAFRLGCLNVVTGPSGAGKSTLLHEELIPYVERHPGEPFAELITVGHAPIGRTPRSNPATYLGIAKHLRDLYAAQPAARERGFTKSHFSFNTKGGRCETCGGAGKRDLGLHLLGRVELPCETCGGDRFRPEVLEVTYGGRSIAACYRLTVREALEVFASEPKVLRGLRTLDELGLGYLTLGQSSTTLSGGEAQRIKIANQLQRPTDGAALFVLTEPSIGLHAANVADLLRVFDAITARGNTIVCVEQHPAILAHADRHIVLGPGGGSAGGQLVYQGPPQPSTLDREPAPTPGVPARSHDAITLTGVHTHLLKHVDVRFPKRQLSVVTGRSGSGKSSLAYDTLYAEASARFSESLSPYVRSLLANDNTARLDGYTGLAPAVGLRRTATSASPRSTVGTLSGAYETLRLLYARVAQRRGLDYSAQHFAYNHALGACPTCAGLGTVRTAAPAELIADARASILDGAATRHKSLDFYTDPAGQYAATLRTAAERHGWDLQRPWRELAPEVQHAILQGTGEQTYEVTWRFHTKSRAGTQQLTAPWLGLCGYLDQEYARTQHTKKAAALDALLHDAPCASCGGKRLRPHLLAVKVRGLDISALAQRRIDEVLDFVDALTSDADSNGHDTAARIIAEAIVPALHERLDAVVQLGLGHLSLDRAARTLSGGERQRVALAGQFAARLYGVTYVLDEPTVGLDRAQVDALLGLLRSLIAQGNTVIAVEHDAHFIEQADYLLELGPGAGAEGGEVMYQGPRAGIASAKHTLTYALLHGAAAPPTLPRRDPGEPFGVRDATANALDGLDANFSSGLITAVTGASGSGKTTLLRDVLYRSWGKGRPVGCAATFGLGQFAHVALLDQSPLAQGRLRTPASISGVLKALQGVYAKSARDAGLKRGDFAYASRGGRCAACSGYGAVRTAMDFLSDVWLTCEACGGLRYSPEVLAHTLRGRSIGEALLLTVDEAHDFFTEAGVCAPLTLLARLGLGHLRLGQAGTTLSGGEAQRLRLATVMLGKTEGPTLFLLDEPSTGLHQTDLARLLDVFGELVTGGDTVVYIEHNPVLVNAAHERLHLASSQAVRR